MDKNLPSKIEKIKSYLNWEKIKTISDIIKTITFIIIAILTYVLISEPESIVNRQLSEETIKRERAKLLIESFKEKDPQKHAIIVHAIKLCYDSIGPKWLRQLEDSLINDYKKVFVDTVVILKEQQVSMKKNVEKLKEVPSKQNEKLIADLMEREAQIESKIAHYDKTINIIAPDTFYTVNLIIPSDMKGAEVLVDNQAAEILKSNDIIITIRIKKKETPIEIKIIKGNKKWTIQRRIENNIKRLPIGE
ncbi:MAG: hypothetical protein V1773_11610 [bacterium]